MMKTLVFYTLVDCRTLEFLKEDGYTDDSLFEALRLNTLQEAQNYLENEVDEECREDFFIYNTRLSCYLELMERDEMQ